MQGSFQKMCLPCCDIMNHKRVHGSSLNGDLEITVLYFTVQKSVLNTNNVYIHSHFLYYLSSLEYDQTGINQTK